MSRVYSLTTGRKPEAQTAAHVFGEEEEEKKATSSDLPSLGLWLGGRPSASYELRALATNVVKAEDVCRGLNSTPCKSRTFPPVCTLTVNKQ